jgi:hypothetical protein
MSIVVITKPPDDGGGFAAGPTPRIKVRIEYTPGPDETPHEIERTTRRLDRLAEHALDL